MANQILAGAVFHAGQVIAGVDADNPPYVGPVIPYILFGGNWADDPQIMNALTGETTAVPIPTSGTGIDGTDGVGRFQLHLADGMVIMVGYTSVTVYTDLSEAGTVLDHPPGGLDNASNFGNDVHVVGDYIYVGTAFEDGHLGTIQIYNKNTLQWHSELKPTGSWYNDSGGSLVFGKSFTVTEETDLYPRSLWVGVPYDDQGAYPNAGKVYRFALGADGLPTGQQNQEIGDGHRNAEYGAFTTSDGEYVAFGYGPAGPGHVNASPDSPYNGKINLTNTIYGPGALALTSGMTDYWTDSSLGSNYPYPPNNDFGGLNNRLIVTDDYIIVANSNHSSSSHNNSNANGAAYGAVFFYDRYGANNNWTTTTPVYSFIAENNSPSIDGVGAWLIECDGKLYVGTRADVALVFNLSDIQAVPAQISRPTAIADSIWHLSSNHSGPILLPSSMIPPPPPPIFNVSSTDDWYMFGSSTVAASGNGFTFERVSGNGNVGQVTITGLTPGQEYELSVTGSAANTSWSSEVAILGVSQMGRAMFGASTASTPVTSTDRWTQSSDDGDSITIRVRIGYAPDQWTGNPAGIWTFTDITINET